MKFEFVTVVYNNIKDTVDFIESIAYMGNNDKLSCVIVDNSDSNDIICAVRDLESIYPFVKVLCSGFNLGYFGAFNYYFSNSSIDVRSIVILCNNDLVFDKNFILNLTNKNFPEDVFVVCPDVITLDGVHQNPHVVNPLGKFRRLKLDLYFSHYFIAVLLKIFQKIQYKVISKKLRYASESPQYLHMGIGACYILLPSFLAQFKMLVYPHFLYGEEAYLSRQVQKAGGKLFYDPDLKVIHKESATLSKIPIRKSYEFGRESYKMYKSFY